MNKQVIILFLIVALLFYYLNEEKQPKRSSGYRSLKENWVVIKKPKTFHSTEPKTFLSAPTFGLNPPHSHLEEMEKADQSSPETLDCPSAEFMPKNLQATEAPSELSPEEKHQRQVQEEADYHWLLNNKTITDWHHEQQLTDAQFQVLRTLVNQEEMKTLQHFLNLLPTNYEWLLISPDFQDQSLITHWKTHFTYEQTQDWLKIGLKPTDYTFAAWLTYTKHLTPDEVLNLADFEKLKAEFTHHGN